jgi:hypothetical protein
MFVTGRIPNKAGNDRPLAPGDNMIYESEKMKDYFSRLIEKKPPWSAAFVIDFMHPEECDLRENETALISP